MVFVKTLAYHALGTLMPYPSEDPPRLLGLFFLIDGCSSRRSNFLPRGEGGIHSISTDKRHPVAAADGQQATLSCLSQPQKQTFNAGCNQPTQFFVLVRLTA
jgi:hypothetical protein